MKRFAIITLLLLLATAAFAQFGGGSRASDQPAVRTLIGQITDKADNPLPNAVVYLKNTKTLAVKTFIAQQDGMYRFPALSPNVDYEVHAELNGKSSDTKTLSAFDSRKEARINLRIDAR